MGRIRNILSLPVTYLKLTDNLKKQKKFLNQNLASSLKEHLRNSDSTLVEKDINKINKYYGLAVPAILGEAFCVLRGEKMKTNERWTLTSQGVVTGLFDDFFDNNLLSHTYIEKLVTAPEKQEVTKSNEKLFQEYYLKSLELCKYPDENKNQAYRVMKDQIDSIEQEDRGITYNRLLEITNNKGGNSVLYYRFGLDNLPDEREIDVLFQLGSTMQLENDLFDVYKDLQSGIVTIPNSTEKVSDIRKLYTDQFQKFISLSHHMHYPKKNIVSFLDIIMPIINRGMVCLDQFDKLARKNGGVFDPFNNSRKELICDMETPGNFFKTIGYCYSVRYC